MNRFIIPVLSKMYKHPVILAVTGIVITALFSAAIPFIKFDNDIKNFLALDHPHRVINDRFDGIFGTSEMIIIGVESDNAYSKETIEYIKWLQGEIEKLNWGYPSKSISSELKLSTDETAKLIEAINQKEVFGKDALKELFNNPCPRKVLMTGVQDY